MKKIMIMLPMLFICTVIFAQTKFQATDTTSKVPVGLYISKSKIMIKSGYTTKTSKDGKIIMVMAPGGDAIITRVACVCAPADRGGDASGCNILVTASTVTCVGGCGTSDCVQVVNVMDEDNQIAMNPEDKPSPITGWKILVIPTTKY